MPDPNPRLQLDPRFTHMVHAAGQVVLVGDDDSAVVEGDAVPELLPLLDGRRTATEIVRAFADRCPPEVVHLALLRLRAAGLVNDVDSSAAFGPRETVRPPELEPSTTSVAVASALRRAWESRGDRCVVLAYLPLPCPVVLTDDYLSPDVPAVITEAGRSDLMMMAKVGQNQVWVGPLVGTAEGACPLCLRERLRTNLTAAALKHAAGELEDLRVVALDRPIPSSAFSTLAEVIGDPAWDHRELRSHIKTFPFDGGGPHVHRVHRLPACERCGDPTLAPPGADVELRPRSYLDSGGGYRVCGPDETWTRFSPLISPLTGVVRRVEPVETPNRDLIHAYTASHAGTYSARSIEAVKDDARDHSGGKGATDIDARVSALCESLERFSAIHRGTEPTRPVRLSDLEGEGAVHPNAVMNVSQAQFRNREVWNQALAGGFQWVPEPYEDQEIAWSPLRSLTTNTVRWLPSALVHLGYRGEGSRFCRSDSNGLAGGNCVEEAILQGFLEVVERDAVALWWYNRGRVPGVDLESSEDEYVDRVVRFYETTGRSLWVIDLTTDMAIPCFAAISAREADTRDDIIFGFGCHFDPDIALRRCVTELNQMLPTVQRSLAERRAQLLPEFRDAVEWWEEERVREHGYLRPRLDTPFRAVADYPAPQLDDLREAVLLCVERASAADLDVLVHDLSRADVRLSVTKVVVPGLRHFWRRLGPGRLYDVPPSLGWVDEITAESAMNPISMFV